MLYSIHRYCHSTTQSLKKRMGSICIAYAGIQQFN
uniref:Uncharacterized protein n=1 Tax=Rhizophora mucronata TaxID=61149 RepID=A0A2P2NGT2_RHIMU